MKISNKEKIMLCVLGSIIVGFVYYQFLYLSQTSEIEAKVKTESELQQKYETVKNTINLMESKKSDIKILKAKIGDETVHFYPTINEENIIIELDKLIRDSELKGGITFQPIVSNSVESSKKDNKSLAESSLQGIVDSYNSIFKDTEKTQNSIEKIVNNPPTNASNSTKDSNNTNAASTSNSTNTANASTDSNKKDSKDAKKNTVKYIKCEVKFEGSYDGINKLLYAISQNDRKIVVNSIKLSSDTKTGIKGTLSLEFYSVPKIDDDLQKYLEWNLNNNYGKSVPFAAGTSSGSINSVATTTKQEIAVPSDFIASVKSINSDLPKVIIGKSKDDLRTTYVYADSNSEEKAEIVFTQNGDKYYYKYKTSKGSFPTNYDGLGEEFIPTSKDIALKVLSERRVDTNDNSSIRLKIINKTNKTVDVNVTGDDASKPRVVIDGDENNIKVSQD